MQKFGLLGKDISYSQSPKLYNTWFQELNIAAQFDLIDRPSFVWDDLTHIQKEYQGICITIPYKKMLFDLLKPVPFASLDAMTLLSGALNCLRFENGSILGMNTDAMALLTLLQPFKQKLYPKSLLMFGAGGAAMASFAAFHEFFKLEKDMNPQIFDVVVRSKGALMQTNSLQPFMNDVFCFDQGPGQSQSTILKPHVLVNATPMGTARSKGDSTLMKHFLKRVDIKNLCLVIDWVYDKQDTMLISWAKHHQIPFIDGITLLKTQAKMNLDFWLS